jgi:ubiquinone/menaquinone biosynthesis C-methylase UbiE
MSDIGNAASAAKDYPLGYSAHEAQRLADQARVMEELTEDLFRRAGLRPGMQILDIGSGVGDVSLLAARITGSGGAVLGVEKAFSSVEIARRRAAELGLQNISFEECDLAEFATDGMFDAIVGRFVLSYIPDRVRVLRRLAEYLRPGGIVAFQEIDMRQIAQTPPSELFLQVRHWLLEGFAASGTELDMGTRLYATFLQAGLPEPDIMAVQPVAGGSKSSGYDALVQSLRSLLPVIERAGIANIEDIGIDTLAERLRKDATTNDCMLFLSRIVSAWARLP